ncbi:2-oxo-4-hydroxy-4-carboxy-5-ureidoimidazoline decarboxylase [Congregibacter litoralis]|uniref:2-oxo-4-hydroxy-4-carboxy-5-ureidoimidazoline decarboxylase n=1 Tax=Congregibacter litoralis KT71 TaxID=314285 RepID=A4A379_9GAMM|nr:2-oxo-4-hydroxy-4-carboxy-5-ureidoimidazoline decarboxylase [Congregibacter litoralis]EAQ99152.1 OHCU decarboxylase [Congregibacter litoralis KT71]
MTLEEFNALDEAAAAQALELCCVSQQWIEGMLRERPFANKSNLRNCAETVWNTLGRDDYLEAFEGHPKIGDVDSLKAKYAGSGNLAAHEQSGVAAATDDVIERLAAGNERYETRFGYIFIVCATGKSALEMCELLEQRLDNDPERELAIAAREQLKILQIRLEQWQ